MTNGFAAKLISASCGLVGFAVAIISGLATSVETSEILTRALIALVACYIVGLVVGAIAERAVADALSGMKEDVQSDAPVEGTSVEIGEPVEAAV